MSLFHHYCVLLITNNYADNIGVLSPY